LRQHPAVELELRELPVEIELGIGAPDLARFVGDEGGPFSGRLLGRERGCAVRRLRLGNSRFGNFLLPGLDRRTEKGGAGTARRD